MRLSVALVFPLLLLTAAPSWAVIITETTDAGIDIPTAFIVPGGTTQINGTIGPATAFGSDVDLYRFGVATTGTFSIQTNRVSGTLDMNLILFNGLGQGLAGDDDDNSGGTPIVPLGTSLDSLLTLTLTAGDYFIAVGDNNMAAFETVADYLVADGSIDFIGNDSEILPGPTTETLGLVGAEFGPTEINDVGDYILYFSSATAATQVNAVPEPSAFAIWGLLGLIVVGFARLRRLK